MQGNLNTALTAPGIETILDFTFYPFGNAFYANLDDGSCPLSCTVDGVYSYYNESDPNPNGWTGCDPISNGRPSARDCWSKMCAYDGTADDDTLCTSGNAVYQHGPGEGLTDVVEACAMDSVGSSEFLLWWPFVYCFEGVKLPASHVYPAYSYGTPKNQTLFEETFGRPGYSFEAAVNLTMEVAEECATVTGLNWTYIENCASPSFGSDGQFNVGTRGEELEKELALATVKLDPPHWYTPWVVFEGTPVWLNDDDAWGGSFSSNNQLLNWICAAYEGPLPEGCPSDPVEIPDNFQTGPSPTPSPTA